MKCKFAIIVLILACQSMLGLCRNTKIHHPAEVIDPEGKYTLEWSVDLVESRITFSIKVLGNGYIGFGLSPGTTMAGADIFIAGVVGTDGTGGSYSGDYTAESNGRPIIDYEQNWGLIYASEKANETQILFTRLLNTGDRYQDIPILDEDRYIIWSYGIDDSLEHHRREGVIIRNLMA